jgi:hypothetical protein
VRDSLRERAKDSFKIHRLRVDYPAAKSRRIGTQGALPSNMTTTNPAASIAKALLLRALDEIGAEAFFSFDHAQQQRATEAASLLDILECAFNLMEVPARSERLAPLFAKVVTAAEAHATAAVNERVAEIQSVLWGDAAAWLAALPEA